MNTRRKYSFFMYIQCIPENMTRKIGIGGKYFSERLLTFL
jgi:hypothetical protein